MNLQSELQKLSTVLQNELSTVDAELKTLPDNSVSMHHQHGNLHLVSTEYKSGQRRRTNLPSGSSEIISLLRRDYLKERRRALEHDRIVLESAIKQLHDSSIFHIVNKISKKYRLSDDGLLLEAMNGARKDDWGSQPYESLVRSDDFAAKKHITSFGLKVRSKSELLIAELLHRFEIQFHYEQLIHIGGETLAPDFTIRLPSGKLIYWEHAGMMRNREYMQRHKRKMELYERAGIVPWSNLIVTYDGDDGTIDLRIVEAEIRNKLLA